MDKKNTSDSLNEAFKSASVTDKIWLFVTRNLRTFARIGIVSIMILFLFATIVIWKNISHRAMETEYNKAVISGNIENFANKYNSKKLGGLLFLELGDNAYRDQNFSKAAKYYNSAAAAFEDNIFSGKAEISEGIALSRNGNIDDAEKIFTKITEKNVYHQFIKGKAMWLLGITFWKKQNLHKAKDIFNKLSNGNFSYFWKEKSKDFLLKI